ncbi:PaaI family thioesterase [Paenalcaligenes niemegkensis]|uniref:PaaI family thioesterase n=1 Tax=Paenalcaligenes niemegkensis TaxID=2895469 RepID=UPI001EE92E42|nr:PaaI family thioesterase [Paenalcaligenes niemegkensis]MCQ9616364.1 PaaI family thioesterase [Paenalcaligenes niemegkensis]
MSESCFSSDAATVTLPLRGDHFGLHIPFMNTIGLQSIQADETGATTLLLWSDANINSRGDVHGGALMSALDYTLGAAARVKIPDSGMATIEMSSQFLSPARGDITLTARCLSIVDDIAHCMAQAHDPKKRLVATATASFKVVRRRGEGSRV